MQGDQTDLSRDCLIAEDKKGEIIGFALIFKSFKQYSWWIESVVVPEYYKSKLSLKLFESILDLINKPNVPQILFNVRKFVFLNSPLQTKFKEMGLNPVHYNFWMRLDDFNSIPNVVSPKDFKFQNEKEITDFDSYVSVINDAFSKNLDFTPYEVEDFKSIHKAAWKEFDIEFWFAFEGKKTVGICNPVINPDLKHIGIINTLAVLHTHHHKGIGSYLLRLGIQSLIKKGCKIIELGVDADNEKGLNLYRKFGFYEVESRTNIVYAINI
ncbi:MAG: GNAT family N-acetyltransferase [Promethearchaeota archaeon]|nr:MAG: GNAT family N-acetyltransferase [Candidatus Lokiarchaeota archaeon]